MDIRRAEPSDFDVISSIAKSAWQVAYESLLQPRTIQAAMENTYSHTALTHRWEDHPIYLAIDREPVAFTDLFIEDDRIVISALYTAVEHQRRGAGSLLLGVAWTLDEHLPVTSDVLLGNRLAEAFYEFHGFVPGETMKSVLFGEEIVERRWWHDAAMPIAF